MVVETLCTVEERLKKNVVEYTSLIDFLTACEHTTKQDEFNNIKPCKVLEVSLNKLLIDVHEQRSLNYANLRRKILLFKGGEVQPIRVFECEEKKGYYVVFDGQHTASVLYILITKVLKQNVEDSTIPVIQYTRSQARSL